ncbi:MAG: ornithine carbamoyltransferase, partial [Spirochaetia bacterium]|nr:ornithine carbamoyltransferase [Spirochaetia bacterium]
YHPTQVLADLMTAMEHIDKPLNKMKMVFVGDARNNMGNSLMLGAAKVGMDFTSLAPRELQPGMKRLEELRKLGSEQGSSIEVSDDIEKAVKGADIVYTDVWVSMGEEAKFAERIALLQPYQVTMEMLKLTGNDQVKFMHCLPAFHDLETSVAREVHERFGLEEMEVTDEVFRSPHSIVFDEAENRLHTIKAVMTASIGNL